MSFLKNALIYLGFVEDDLQGEIASYGDPQPRRSRVETEDRYEPQARAFDERYQVASQTYEDTRSYEDTRTYDYEGRGEPIEREPRRSEQLASVHQLAPPPQRGMGQVHIVRPESYGDAQQIGDRMRRGLPVIVNLEEAESELARRIVAFASGLVYGLDGNLQKLSRRIYLITPAEMEVSSEDKRRLVEDTGLGF
ncbi:MAG TPA: cell division protein SepF [Actinomycetota bacterium]|nr:cell division protein SepF [Actinomycetota bacterium]